MLLSSVFSRWEEVIPKKFPNFFARFPEFYYHLIK